MCLTTEQQLYQEFRNDDNALEFEDAFDDLDFLDGSSLAIDDGRTFSTSSDISEISYGNLQSDTLYTTALGIDDRKTVSSVSNFSERTFQNLVSDALFPAPPHEPEDSVNESSESISEGHVTSMVAFLEASRHTSSTSLSFTTKADDSDLVASFNKWIQATDPCKPQPKARSHNAIASQKPVEVTPSEKLNAHILVRSDEIQNWDVLSGRGGKSNHHIGNKVFRHLITEMRPAYHSSKTRSEKAMITESLIQKVHRMGGRFLIQNKGRLEPHWSIMTKIEVRRKTSQALRETRTLQWTQ
jgi:hypothetical protein